MQYNQLCFCDKFCQEKILTIYISLSFNNTKNLIKRFFCFTPKLIILVIIDINNKSTRIKWNPQQLKPRRNSSGQENNTEYQQDSPCCSSGCSNGIGSEGCSPETPGNSWKVKGHRMNALWI